PAAVTAAAGRAAAGLRRAARFLPSAEPARGNHRHDMPTPRRALLAGATGLVGRAMLPLLLRSHAPVRVLVRRTVDLGADPRIEVILVDFAALPALPPVDDVFIGLGTTIKVAGSQAAFRSVDLDAV